MDNRFTMADITLNKSIPYVRELTNSVSLVESAVICLRKLMIGLARYPIVHVASPAEND
jgi:hypothetical protein